MLQLVNHVLRPKHFPSGYRGGGQIKLPADSMIWFAFAEPLGGLFRADPGYFDFTTAYH